RARLRDDPAGAAAILREALALWRGPALADVADADFAKAPVARLEELRLTAVQDRIDADLRVGAATLEAGNPPLLPRPEGPGARAAGAAGGEGEGGAAGGGRGKRGGGGVRAPPGALGRAAWWRAVPGTRRAACLDPARRTARRHADRQCAATRPRPDRHCGDQ